jgi:hypothetical protein
MTGPFVNILGTDMKKIMVLAIYEPAVEDVVAILENYADLEPLLRHWETKFRDKVVWTAPEEFKIAGHHYKITYPRLWTDFDKPTS